MSNDCFVVINKEKSGHAYVDDTSYIVIIWVWAQDLTCALHAVLEPPSLTVH